MKVNQINKVVFLLTTVFSINSFAITSTTGTVNVSATVAATCVFGTAVTLDFSTVNLAGNTDANGSLSMSCTDAAASITATVTGLHDGQVGGYEYAMYDGSGAYLGYNLYTDNTYSVAWSDSVGTAVALTSGAANLNFYGRILNNQTTYAGGPNLSDTVTVAVSF